MMVNNEMKREWNEIVVAFGGTRKNNENLARMVNILAKIRTGHLPKKKSEERTDVATLLRDMVMGCLFKGNHHHIKLHFCASKYDFWKCSPTTNKLRATLTQIFERS